MSSTAHAERAAWRRRGVLGLAMASGMSSAFARTARSSESDKADTLQGSLTPRQFAIGPIAVATAVGDMPRLNAALERGLEAGLTINDIREVLVQLYAYAGFPRSLNALGEFIKVLGARRARGVSDAEGRAPGPLPSAGRMLAVGAENQTKLSGAPVRGALFEFAPAIDQFLKSHLFGDIFARDNVDWPSRELATVAALGALDGVEAQLLAHIRISLNVGLTGEQLKAFGSELADRGDTQAGARVLAAIAKHLKA